MATSSSESVATTILMNRFVRRNHRFLITLRERRLVQRQIVAVLEARKPHACSQARARLPSLAQKLEKVLFHIALSRSEYLNPTTLLWRLAQIYHRSQHHAPSHAAISL
ncbi:unnamed protein product [Aphanomyces euteiches]